MRKIEIKQLAKDLHLEIVYDADQESIEFDVNSAHRPGLQLTGFNEYFAKERVQVMGKAEWTYFSTLSKEIKKKRAEEFMAYKVPCVIISRNLEFDEAIIEAAKKYKVPLFRSKVNTVKLTVDIISYLNYKLAAEETRHGVLVDVYGIGVLLKGKSGIGKSETALELIKRGHRLVADDAVQIRKISDERLIGNAPALIKHFIEIRGVGILDIVKLFGVGAVKKEKYVDLVIEMENWIEGKMYERLGIDDEYMDILGVKVNKLTLPIKPGRNLAMLVEVAAGNFSQKAMGYNAARELNNRIINHTKNKKK